MKKIVAMVAMLVLFVGMSAKCEYSAKTVEFSGIIAREGREKMQTVYKLLCWGKSGYYEIESRSQDGSPYHPQEIEKTTPISRFAYLEFTVKKANGKLVVCRIGTSYCISSPLEDRWEEISPLLVLGQKIKIRGSLGEEENAGIVYPSQIDVNGTVFK